MLSFPRLASLRRLSRPPQLFSPTRSIFRPAATSRPRRTLWTPTPKQDLDDDAPASEAKPPRPKNEKWFRGTKRLKLAASSPRTEEYQAVFCEEPIASKLAYKQKDLLPLIQNTPWSLGLNGRRLKRGYSFADCASVLVFIDKVFAHARKRRHPPRCAVAGTRVFIEWTTTEGSPNGVGGISSLDVLMAEKCDEIASRLGERLVENSDDGFRYSAGWEDQDHLRYPLCRRFKSWRKAELHCRALLEEAVAAEEKQKREGPRTREPTGFPLWSIWETFVWESQTRFTVSERHGAPVFVPINIFTQEQFLEKNRLRKEVLGFQGRKSGDEERELRFEKKGLNPVPGILENMINCVTRRWKESCPGYENWRWDKRVSELESKGVIWKQDKGERELEEQRELLKQTSFSWVTIEKAAAQGR